MTGGVDWLTVTCADRFRIEKAQELAFALTAVELSMGMYGKPWHQSGYDGFACGHVQYGERTDGCIVRFGSILAQAHWRRLYELADHVTRIDLQATFCMDEEANVVVHRHYKELARAQKKSRRPPKLSRLQEHGGGYTVYTGRKISDVFGRIYNKGAQTKLLQDHGCVRYEVQFNGERARGVASDIVMRSLTNASLAATSLSFFAGRGVCLGKLPEQCSPYVFVKTSYPRRSNTDVDGSLKWLAACVGPTVSRLLNSGYLQEVQSALKLHVVQ